jgi:type VI protein secretion system component Hcp
MNPSRRLAAVLSGALLTSASAVAASDYLLELEGIEGDARAGRQTLEVQSFSWGTSNAGAMPAGSGGSSGKVNVHDISLTVAAPGEAASGLASGRRSVVAGNVEAAAVAAPVVRDVSITLPEAAAKSVCASGKHIAKANLNARGERVELEDVIVTSCTTQAGVSVVSMRGHTKTGHVTLMK